MQSSLMLSGKDFHQARHWKSHFQKVEVIQMILETYDKELHDKTLRREGYEDGYNEGLAAAKETGIRQFISTLQELQLSHENVLKKLHEKYELSQEESEIYMKKYWEK